MQFVRHMLMYTAVIFMLLHSIVPHHHAQEDIDHGCNVEQESGDFLDYLTLLFHEDLGSDHLEDFIPSAQAMVFLPPNDTPSLDAPVHWLLEARQVSVLINPLSGHLLSRSGRGPPLTTFV